MTKKFEYCHRHPDVASMGECEECGKPVCYNCVRKFAGRIYCGWSCAVNAARKRIFKTLAGLSRPGGPLKKAGLWAWKNVRTRRFLEALMALGLVFCLCEIISLNRRIGRSEKGIAETHAEADSAATAPIQMFQPAKGGMVTKNRIEISGSAEENWIISLSVNGKLKEVMLAKDGRFSFRDIELFRGGNDIVVRALNEQGEVYTLETLKLNFGAPLLSYLATDFRRGPESRREVAFTFDGGSMNNAADEILNILKSQKVHSTFFLTGEFIRKYPETVKRIAEEGHEVGNHTWGHPHLTTLETNGKQDTAPSITKARIKEELDRAAAQFKKVTGREMSRIWRAPYGEINRQILLWAAEAGYRHVGWTVGKGWEESMDTLDWVADKKSKVYHSADEIAQKILGYTGNGKNGASGAVILMHLGTERSDDFPHQKLPGIISGLKQKGYSAVTVTEMMTAE